MTTFARALAAAVLAAVCLAAGAAPAGAQAAPTDPDLAKGMRLVDEGEFDNALPALNAVVARLQSKGGNPSELSRAYLYLAIAHLGLSQEQAARAKFLDALKTDRSLSLSPYEFPPKVIQAFEQARREVAAQGAPARPVRSVPQGVFLESVKQGDFPAVRQMLGDDPSLATRKDERFGATPLHWAALRGNQAIVALLLAEGADPGATNAAGETPLQVAERANRPDVVSLLRPAGAFSATGGIFDAVKRGDVGTVKALLTESPDLVRQKDTAFGATPLHWAALRGQDAVVELLLARGADPRVTNNDGETPLQVAERAKREGAAGLLRKATGAPPAAIAPAGASAADRPAAVAVAGDIFAAVRAGDLAAVSALLVRQPSLVNEKDPRFGATPLHWAALKGYDTITDLLLARGGDVRATNNAGETPLQVAERGRQENVARLLRAAMAPAASPAPRP